MGDSSEISTEFACTDYELPKAKEELLITRFPLYPTNVHLGYFPAEQRENPILLNRLYIYPGLNPGMVP